MTRIKHKFNNNVEIDGVEYPYMAVATFAYNGIGEYEAGGVKKFDKGVFCLIDCEILRLEVCELEIPDDATFRQIRVHATTVALNEMNCRFNAQ